MLKYETKKRVSYHMNSILVQEWDAFKGSSGKIIKELFVETKLITLSPPEYFSNTQACVASV